MDKPGSRVWVAESAMSLSLRLADDRHPYETGGMLLGYEAGNGEAVITRLIGPGPKAEHSRFTFSPDSEYQQSELEAHFRATNGRETYLGDWHTHPHSNSSLSRVDKKTLARIAVTPASGTENPLMAILGGGTGTWEFGAVRFLGIRRGWLFDGYNLASLTAQTF
jgi:integrative and conjugative element protein (TIGR02256 family)